MNEYKQLWKKFTADVNRHTEQGEVSLKESKWLLSETSKYCIMLDNLEIKLDTPDLPWDEREKITKECCEIIKILTELEKRMEIEQKFIFSGMQENVALCEEYDRLEKIRQLDNPESHDRI